MSEPTPDDVAPDKILHRIQGLIQKADSTEFGEERDLLRAKAEELMKKWRVESWQLDEARAARGESRALKIEKRNLSSTGEFREEFFLMLNSMCQAIGVKCAWWADNFWEDGRPMWRFQMVGYELDLVYMEMLYASLMMEAAATLEAKPERHLSFEENIWRLHESGVQWERIRVVMNTERERGATWRLVPGAYAYTDPITGKFIPGKSDGGVMRRAAKSWCDRLGVEYHSVVNGRAYRESFVKGFTRRITQRFWELQQKVERSTAIVLFDRNKAVEDEFAKLHPSLGVHKEKTGRRMVDAAYKRGSTAAERARLDRNDNSMRNAKEKQQNSIPGN